MRWQAAQGFAEAFQLTINRSKSRVVAEPAPLRAALAAALPGAAVSSEVKDLGVLQQLGRRPSGALLAQRVAEACSWLRRVGVLPLPRQQLLRIAAAAGVSVAVYGAACGTLPRDAARRLRASAAWAVSRVLRSCASC